MKIDAKEVLRPTITLTVICFVVAALLAGTNLLTEDKIAQQEEQAASEARELVIPGVEEFEEMEAMDADGEDVYKRQVEFRFEFAVIDFGIPGCHDKNTTAVRL